MKRLLLLSIFIFSCMLLQAQDPVQEFNSGLKLEYYPEMISADSVLVTNGTKQIGFVSKSALEQTLELDGTTIKISGQNTIDIGPLVGNNALWGNITGLLSNQTDLQAALDSKQETLVNGVNIRTINGLDLLGTGDLVISATGGEVNNLEQVVTWVDVPIANIPVDEINITESQISDLQHTVDTKLTPAEVKIAIDSEYPDLDTDSTDDFSGDYDDLTNKPLLTFSSILSNGSDAGGQSITNVGDFIPSPLPGQISNDSGLGSIASPWAETFLQRVYSQGNGIDHEKIWDYGSVSSGFFTFRYDILGDQNVPPTLYSLNPSGTPSQDTDLVNLKYFQDNVGSGGGSGTVTKIGTAIPDALSFWSEDGVLDTDNSVTWNGYNFLKTGSSLGLKLNNGSAYQSEVTLQSGINGLATLTGGNGTVSRSIEVSGIAISSNVTPAQIESKGATSLITKAYADANYGGDNMLQKNVENIVTSETSIKRGEAAVRLLDNDVLQLRGGRIGPLDYTVLDIGRNTFRVSLGHSGGPNPDTVYTLNSNNIPTADTDLINKGYADANYGGAGGGLTTDQIAFFNNKGQHTYEMHTSDFVWDADDSMIGSGSNTGKRVINAVDGTNDVTVTIPNLDSSTGQNGFMESTSDNSVISAIPDTGVQFQINHEDISGGVRTVGKSNLDYAEKTNGVMNFTGANIEAFALAPTNLYRENSGANQGTGVGSWVGKDGSGSTGSVTRVLDTDFDGGIALEINNSGAQFAGAGLDILPSDVVVWSNGFITQLDPNDVYEVSFDYKTENGGGNGVQAGYYSVRQNDTNTPQGPIPNSNTVNTMSYQFTVPSGGLSTGLNALGINSNYAGDFSGWFRLANFSIIKITDN